MRARVRARARKLQLLARAPNGPARHGSLAAALAHRSCHCGDGVETLIPRSAPTAKLKRLEAIGLTSTERRGFDEMLLILAHASDLW